MSCAQSFEEFRDVEVSDFGIAIFEQENIGTFHISVQNSNIMERLESSDYLNEDGPDLILFELGIALEVLLNSGVEVTVICEFHDDATL